jgi:hypothetical protein
MDLLWIIRGFHSNGGITVNYNKDLTIASHYKAGLAKLNQQEGHIVR